MSNIKRMKDKDGNYIYPVTHASAVFDGDDESIGEKLGSLKYTSVKKFGAKGDGTSDDTKAIQDALNSMEFIYFPKGTYIVTEPLKINMRQKIEGYGEQSIIKANAEIESVFYVYDSNASITGSFIGINGISIDCNKKADIGIKLITFTNGSYFTNSYIKNALEAGMYISNSWYAKYDNIQILACKVGLEINDYVDAATKHDLVNAINFSNIFINNSSQYGLHVKGRSYAMSFTSCTFEKSGVTNIKIDGMVSTITFNNCYCESSTHALVCDGSHANGLVGTLNLLGGYYNAKDTMVIVGETTPIQQLNIIGAAMCSWDSTNYPDHFVKSYAKYNLFEAHMHGLAKVAAYYYTGYAAGNFFKDYGAKEGYTHSNLKTGKIECVEKATYGKACQSTFAIGSSVDTCADNGGAYKYTMGIINNYNRGFQIKQSVKGGADKVSLTIDHNNVTRAGRLAYPVGHTSARPAAPYESECFYDLDLHKPIWWNGTKWIDGAGNEV